MDLQKIISDLVAKLMGNTDLIAKFTSNPLALVKDLLGIDLDADQLAKVVQGVQSALGASAGDALEQGKSVLDKIKGLFSK